MKNRLTIIGIIAIMLLSGTGEVFADCWSDPGPCILQAIIDFFLPDPSEVANALKPMILTNPDPSDVAPLMDSYLDLMHPIFVLSIIILGFYLIFMSGSPGGRAAAKNRFWKLILTMILVSLSLEIFKILLGISEGITAKVLGGVTDGSIEFSAIETITFVLVQLFLYMVYIWILISIGLRYILVLICAALFPITIFLYLFEMPIIGAMGREMGAKMWRWTLAVIFAQVIQGVMLAITVISFGNISEAAGWGKLGAAFIGIAGFVLIALAPLMMLGILKWIGGAMMGMGMAVSLGNPALGFAMTAMGGLMMGQGPASALMAAGGAAGMGFALRKGQEAAELGMKEKMKEMEIKRRQTRLDYDFKDE